MSRIRVRSEQSQLLTLVQLTFLGAGSTFADIPSARLGRALGLTQQAASRRLITLEGEGLVQRAHSGRGLTIKITEAGLERVRSFYGELKGSLEARADELSFRGRVFTGLGEGRFYVSLKGYSRHFQEALGFVPFPGTLNLRLTSSSQIEQRGRLESLKGIEVPGFEDGRRSYGPVKVFRARVGGKYPGAILAIERTHYDDSVLEAISPVNLRKALGLKDGDECSVTSYFD